VISLDASCSLVKAADWKSHQRVAHAPPTPLHERSGQHERNGRCDGPDRPAQPLGAEHGHDGADQAEPQRRQSVEHHPPARRTRVIAQHKGQGRQDDAAQARLPDQFDPARAAGKGQRQRNRRAPGPDRQTMS
jgi:hypothetical protein